MNILLFIDLLYPTDHAFIEQIFSKLLPEKGYKIKCIARTNKKIDKVIKWNRIEVYTFYIGEKFSFVRNLTSRIKMLKCSLDLYKKNKFRIFFVRNWEYGGFIAILFKYIFSVTFIYQRTFPTDENYRASIKDNYTPLIKKFIKIFLLFVYHRIIRKADYIFSISEQMKNEMIKMGYSSQIIYPIGLAFDNNVVTDVVSKNKISGVLQLNHFRVLLYLGKMDLKRNLEFLLDVFKELNNKNIRLIMLGGSDNDIMRLKKYSISNGIDNRVIFIGKVDRNEVTNFISLAYLTLSPIPPISRYKVASPTKLFESLGLGVPVIGNDIPMQKKVLNESQGGICVPYAKVSFKEAIKFLLEHPEKREEMSQNAKKYILENYTYDILAERINKIFLESVPNES